VTALADRPIFLSQLSNDDPRVMQRVIDKLRLIVDHHDGPLFGVVRFPGTHEFIAGITGLREIGPRQADLIRESLLARRDATDQRLRVGQTIERIGNLSGMGRPELSSARGHRVSEVVTKTGAPFCSALRFAWSSIPVMKAWLAISW